MQLTNFTFLQSRNDYMSSIAQRKIASDRASGGKMLERSGEVMGALSHAVQVMSGSNKLKDFLIPLTTNHFRGAPLSSSL